MVARCSAIPGAWPRARALPTQRRARPTGTPGDALRWSMIERHDDTRPRDDAASLRRDLVGKLYFELAKFPAVATRNDQFLAFAFAVRDRLLHRWIESSRTFFEGKHRSVIYLSAEFLIGPQLGANLLALGLEDEVRAAADALGISLDTLVEHEEEPGLGNGG